ALPISSLPQNIQRQPCPCAFGKRRRALGKRRNSLHSQILVGPHHADHRVYLRQFHSQPHGLEFIGADFAELPSPSVEQSRNRVSISHVLSVATCRDEVIRTLG